MQLLRSTESRTP